MESLKRGESKESTRSENPRSNREIAAHGVKEARGSGGGRKKEERGGAGAGTGLHIGGRPGPDDPV